MSQNDNYNNQPNQAAKKKRTGLKIVLGIIGVLLLIAIVLVAMNWTNISTYLNDKRNGVINERIQYDLTVPDNAWIDDRYASGFGEQFEVLGLVIGVSTDGNTLVTITDYSDGERLLLYDLHSGDLIKEFEGAFYYPFLYKSYAYTTTHIPLVINTETATELIYLDLNNLELKSLIKFNLGDSFDILAFDSADNFVLGKYFAAKDGSPYYSYAAYIDRKFAWAANFNSPPPFSQANSDYLFLSNDNSAFKDAGEKTYLTIIDRKTGELVLENKELDGNFTILQDGFIENPPSKLSGGISFQDIEASKKRINKVYDVKGDLLGEIIGYPHIPYYPEQKLGGYITAANVLNEDVKKASGVVYLIDAEGKVVAYSVFIGDTIFPKTGARIDEYIYPSFNACNKDGSIIIAEKMGDTIEDYTTVILDNKFNVIDEYKTGMNVRFLTESGILWGDNIYGTSWVLPPKRN